MTLQELIAADPDGRGYATMEDADVAADLNTPRHPRRKPIPVDVFSRALVDAGVLAAAVTKAKGSLVLESAKFALELMDRAAMYNYQTIDIDRPDFTGLLNQMESELVITAAQKATLLALADQLISLAEKEGLPSVTHIQVAEARGRVL